MTKSGYEILVDHECVLQINEESEIFNVDHHYPGSENRSLVAILYGEIGSPNFKAFHSVLKEHAIEGKIDYILRHNVEVSFIEKYSYNVVIILEKLILAPNE